MYMYQKIQKQLHDNNCMEGTYQQICDIKILLSKRTVRKKTGKEQKSEGGGGRGGRKKKGPILPRYPQNRSSRSPTNKETH